MAIATTIEATLQATGDGAILFDAGALAQAGGERFDPVLAEETLGSVIKDHDDHVLVRNSLSQVLEG